MRKLILVVLVALMCCVSFSLAFSKELPNEVDLQAAYCVAIVKKDLASCQAMIPDQIAYEKKNFPGKVHDDPKSDELIYELIKDTEFKLHRLEAYLTPRLQYLEPQGLLISMKRGEEDKIRSDNETSICFDSFQEPVCKTCQDTPCKNKCTFDSMDNLSSKIKCVDENETHKRMITKCDEGLTFLPY